MRGKEKGREISFIHITKISLSACLGERNTSPDIKIPPTSDLAIKVRKKEEMEQAAEEMKSLLLSPSRNKNILLPGGRSSKPQ